MIVFGAAIADQDRFDRWAMRGIATVAEPDSIVITRQGHDSIQGPYNSILDAAAGFSELEAVVLVHEDTEIDDPELIVKIRNAFADPSVAVIGPIGGRAVPGMAWWEGETFGRVGAPNVTSLGVMLAAVPYGWHRVESLDGLMLVLSPWAAREVRFDERFAPYFHGYDIDYCFQVRARGRDCVVVPLGAIHYGTWKPDQSSAWVAASLVWHRKWATGGILPRPAHLAWA
jgi:GT2 family glycosyltransferase